MSQITIKFRYDELPKPVDEYFLLKVKDGKIQRKELSPFLKKNFVDSESLTYAFDVRNK